MEEEIEIPEEYDEPDFKEDVDWDDLTIVQQKNLKNKVDRVMQKMVRKQSPKQRHTTKQARATKLGDEYKGIIGKYIFRDMPLFKYEWIIYIFVGLFAFILAMLELLELVEGAAMKALIPVILAPIVIWFIKMKMYMPSKTRVPSVRIYRTGVVELRVEDVKKGFITYGSGDNIQRKYITKINKHTEASTGKPIIFTSEHQGENLDLLANEKVDMQGKETTALLEMNTAVTTKNVMNKMLSTQLPSLQNPLFLLLLVNMFLVAILVVKSFGVLDFLQAGI